MRTAPIVLRAAAVSFVLWPSLLWAQTPPKPQTPSPPELADPPGENATPPSDPSTGGAEPTKPLTKELHDNEGVLEPPRGVDPQIEKKPPEDFEGKTPVIPPPGEPGGSPDVQPE